MSDLTVLIVDDDESFRRLVQIRLQDWRPEIFITTAGTLAEASSKLDSSNFGLVILDQHLPDGMSSDFSHPGLASATVLAVSSDEAPDIPAKAVKSGAQHFLGKRQISDALLIPLIEAMLERKELEKQVIAAKIQESKMDSIQRLLTTLKHEINNPLGAVLGGTYLVKSSGTLDEEQKKALDLIDESGKRIKHVLSQLCDAADLEAVDKASEEVFQIPGDKRWDEN